MLIYIDLAPKLSSGFGEITFTDHMIIFVCHSEIYNLELGQYRSLSGCSVNTIDLSSGSRMVCNRYILNASILGSNPLCYRFEVWAFLFSSRRLSRLSCINEYLAIDSGGNVSE